MDCSLPGCSVHGLLQARILQWVTIPFSRGSFQPRDRTQVSHLARRFFTIWVTREALYIHKSLSCVWLFVTPWTVVHGILQARILVWVVFPFSRGSSQPRDQTQVSHLAGGFFTIWAKGKPKITGVGSRSLLQGIFLIQESNWGLLHCRWVFTSWATREALKITYTII